MTDIGEFDCYIIFFFSSKSRHTMCTQVTGVQTCLFRSNLLAPIMEKKSKTLMQAIDLTNAKYGRNAISIAQAGINNDWKMRREHSSKIDTASFDFLPEISV